MLLLDDIVGFIGGRILGSSGYPASRNCTPTPGLVRFFHNDAQCAKSIGYYPEIGINLYNPGIFNTLAELREMSANRLTILGNIPPREVLAKGTPADMCGRRCRSS